MNGLARHHFWWPNLDADIENVSFMCDACQQKAHNPAKSELHPWEFPSRPWQRLHIDFAGPIFGYTWLVYVDAYSKYPGAIPLTTTTASSTTNALLEVFSHFGLPEQLVSDNGPPFDSYDFAVFCKSNGIRHSRSAPYHPQSNGEAERFVQTFKDSLKSSGADATSAKRLASEFLLRYRVSAHGTTGASPSQLLLGRAPRTKLDLLHPDMEVRVRGRQESDKLRYDSSAKLREFNVGDPVFSRNYFGRYRWKAGVILRRTGPVSYDVQVGNGVDHRHASQLRGRQLSMDHPSEEEEIDRDIQSAFDAAEERQW